MKNLKDQLLLHIHITEEWLDVTVLNVMAICTKILHEIKENSVNDQDSEIVQDTPLSLLEDNSISHDKNLKSDEKTVIQ